MHLCLQVGTPLYCAPEIFLGENYSESVDIYSLGVMLNEMDVQELPYGRFRFNRLKVSENNLRPTIKSECADFKLLVMDCWSQDPSKRPSAEEILGRLHATGSMFDETRAYVKEPNAEQDVLSALYFTKRSTSLDLGVSPLLSAESAFLDEGEEAAEEEAEKKEACKLDGGATAVLELSTFVDVTAIEMQGIATMQVQLGPEASDQPIDVGGEVALLRWLRHHKGNLESALAAYRRCLGRRSEHNLCGVRDALFGDDGEVLTQVTELAPFLALIPLNNAFGLTARGDLGVFLGETRSSELINVGEEYLTKNMILWHEQMHIILDRVSRSQRIIASVVFLFDVEAVAFEHRKILRQFKWMANIFATEETHALGWARCLYFLGVRRLSRGVIRSCTFFLPGHIRAKFRLLALLTGDARGTQRRICPLRFAGSTWRHKLSHLNGALTARDRFAACFATAGFI